MPHPTLSTLSGLPTSLAPRKDCSLHFINAETKAQRDWVTCPKSQRQQAAETAYWPICLTLRLILLTLTSDSILKYTICRGRIIFFPPNCHNLILLYFHSQASGQSLIAVRDAKCWPASSIHISSVPGNEPCADMHRLGTTLWGRIH